MFVLSLLWFAATAGNHTKDVGFVEPRTLVDYQLITEGGGICARRVGRMPRNPKRKYSIWIYDKQLYFIKKLTNNQQNVF